MVTRSHAAGEAAMMALIVRYRTICPCPDGSCQPRGTSVWALRATCRSEPCLLRGIGRNFPEGYLQERSR